jgi:hypothetical protein
MRSKVELHTIVFIGNGAEDVAETVLIPIRRTRSAVKTTVPETNRTLRDYAKLIVQINSCWA